MKLLNKSTEYSIDLTSVNEGYRLTFTSPSDKMGMLYAISAVLFARNWSIVDSQASTSKHGIEDTFILKPMEEGLSAYIRKFYIMSDLKELLEEDITIREYLSKFPEKLEDLKDSRKNKMIDYHVTVRPDEDIFVIEIETEDRPGLILDLSQAFFYLYFDVIFMKSVTEGPVARDIIHVKRSEEKATEFDKSILEEALNKI